MMVSGHPDRQSTTDGRFVIKHEPRWPAHGVRWHLEHIRYGLRLLRLARNFNADTAIIDSGTMPLPMLALFSASGMRVVPVFHNTLRPVQGQSALSRLTLPLSKAAIRLSRPISVSPAVYRQVGRGHQMRAQFTREYFARISPPQFKAPFNVLYVGRVEVDKGVFDIVEAAKICGNIVHWTICGDGSAVDRLRQEAKGLPIDVLGFVNGEEQVALRSDCQAVIVPTKSSFTEGLAMSAVEAILSYRPLVTNCVVPALELLRPASVEVKPDDPTSIAAGVLALAQDRSLWQSKVDACDQLGDPFYDRRNGLAEVLRLTLS